MSYLDSPNPESPSRFLDFQTPDIKNFEGLLQSPPSPSYFSFELQETDISFRNMFAPKPNSCDSSFIAKEAGTNVFINQVSFDSSSEVQLPSFERYQETQKNSDASFTLFEESDKDYKKDTCNYSGLFNLY